MRAKKGERVVIEAGWSGSAYQRFKVERITTFAVHGTWETGPLATKEAAIAHEHFRVVESLGLEARQPE